MDPNRILSNPGLEAMPGVNSPLMLMYIQMAMANGRTQEQAVQTFQDTWTTDNEARVIQWNQQVENDERLLREKPLVRMQLGEMPQLRRQLRGTPLQQKWRRKNLSKRLRSKQQKKLERRIRKRQPIPILRQ